jgi:hypothetical protein
MRKRVVYLDWSNDHLFRFAQEPRLRRHANARKIKRRLGFDKLAILDYHPMREFVKLSDRRALRPMSCSLLYLP